MCATSAADVADILTSLGVKADTPMFEVWNKLDLVDPTAHEALTVQAQTRPHVFPISALTGEGIDTLSDAISRAFDELKQQATLTLTFAQGRAYAWLQSEGVITEESQSDEGWTLQVAWTERQQGRYNAL